MFSGRKLQGADLLKTKNVNSDLRPN